jgi:hypothetical protein
LIARAFSLTIVGFRPETWQVWIMTETTATIRVECYSGHRGDEAPRRFILGEQRIEVVEIVDRWLDPAHRYFKVRGDDGGVYVLRHDVPKDEWEMTFFDSDARADTRLSST